MNLETSLQNMSQTLRILKKVNPDVRKKVPNMFKSVAKPIQDEARRRVPLKPTSGWKPGGRTGWKASAAKRSITFKFRATSRSREQLNFNLLTLTSGKNPAMAIYDMAGRKNRVRTRQGVEFVGALKANNERASRVLWPAVESKQPYIRDELEKIVTKIENEVSESIRRLR